MLQPLMDKSNVFVAGVMDNWREIVQLNWHRVVALHGEPLKLAEMGVGRDSKRQKHYRKTFDDYVASAIHWNISVIPEIKKLTGSKFEMLDWDKQSDKNVSRLKGMLKPKSGEPKSNIRRVWTRKGIWPVWNKGVKFIPDEAQSSKRGRI